MKASKDRKMDRKRKHKALAAAKTDKSRKRRLDNKAIRDEIHAVDPDAKVDIKNQRPYVNGKPVKVVDNEIKPILIL